MSADIPAAQSTTGIPKSSLSRPRIGFLGVGWIGRHRMEAIVEAGGAEVVAVADPVPEVLEAALALAPHARRLGDLEALLEEDLDAIVIATPSAFHAEQSIRALEAGRAVFCQKPLGRSAAETRRVVEAAQKADRLLGVDLSYRFVRGVQRIQEAVQRGEIGEVYAVELTFHNAYGPDKPWFYDKARSGGGCVIDLGIHLVDLAFWTLGFPDVRHATSRLFAEGRPFTADATRVEDYAVARLDLEGGASVRLACSWRLPAGQDAVIEAAFYGTGGGLMLRNVGGSFYDFVAERLRGTARETLAEGPNAWGGRAAADWALRLAKSNRFDPEIASVIAVAEALDAIYAAHTHDA